ncbi:MAG TPA: methyltransferase domain-containing protein [Candidatus Eisenbacteria bacterium]|nr:methyltransferase domain-containing protein [Candidatus Eisenbacteria bacterium]
MDLSEAPAVVLRRHPWELARLDFFRRQLRTLGVERRPIEVLDVGSGDAWLATTLLASLHEGSHVTCWDSGYSPAHLDELRGRFGPRARFVVERPEERFDLVLLLDVLEHVDDDAGFLRAIVDHNLKDGGHALISVPAWRALFGDHDMRLHHVRRYQPDEATRLLDRSGLTIQARGGLFHSLLLPRVAERLAARAGLVRKPPPHLGEWRAGRVVSAMVETVLKWDGSLGAILAKRRIALPGLSWWATCVKRS